MPMPDSSFYEVGALITVTSQSQAMLGVNWESVTIRALTRRYTKTGLYTKTGAGHALVFYDIDADRAHVVEVAPRGKKSALVRLRWLLLSHSEADHAIFGGLSYPINWKQSDLLSNGGNGWLVILDKDETLVVDHAGQIA